MSELRTHITTGEAADVMQVHESTVKRWCDAGDLECDVTSGGHRRIDLDSLLTYAARSGLKCELLAFGSDGRAAYEARTRIVREGDFGSGSALVHAWLVANESDLTSLFFTYLIHSSISIAAISDEIVRPVMRGVGHAWETGDIGVGDEHRMSHAMMDAIYGFRTLLRREVSRNGRVAVVACLEGNQHALAANLVRIVLEAGGWNVVFLGADVPLYEIAIQQRIFDASLVCISTAKPQVAADALRSAHILSTTYEPAHPYRLAIGGSPVGRLPADSDTELPFTNYRLFTNMMDFAKWIEDAARTRNGEDET